MDSMNTAQDPAVKAKIKRETEKLHQCAEQNMDVSQSHPRRWSFHGCNSRVQIQLMQLINTPYTYSQE